MTRRAVSERDVESALRRRVSDPSPGEPGTMWIWAHAFDGRVLKVCVRVDEPDYVITVAWPEGSA